MYPIEGVTGYLDKCRCRGFALGRRLRSCQRNVLAHQPPLVPLLLPTLSSRFSPLGMSGKSTPPSGESPRSGMSGESSPSSGWGMMRHGATPVTLQRSLFSMMLAVQHPSPPPSSAEHPLPPHAPHEVRQQATPLEDSIPKTLSVLGQTASETRVARGEVLSRSGYFPRRQRNLGKHAMVLLQMMRPYKLRANAALYAHHHRGCPASRHRQVAAR